MQLELRTEFKLVRSATTVDLIQATCAAFAGAGLTPVVRFRLAEYDGHKTSAVARTTRRFPDLARFDRMQPVSWEPARTERMLTNETGTPGANASFDFATLLEVVSGIPRRYPFFTAAVRMTHPAFGPETTPFTRQGVLVEDSWGAAKRSITRHAVVLLDADPGAPSLPPLPASVVTVLDACDRRSATTQAILSGQDPSGKEVVAAIRKKTSALLDELAKRIRLPHDIPLRDDRPPEQPVTSYKPILAATVRPLGYECRGGGLGALVCRRRNASNIATRLYLDFGTMRDTLYATWAVAWLDGGLSIRLPSYSYNGWEGMRRVLDETRWRQVVANLATTIAELDRLVLPVVEATARPTPAWYEPAVGGWGLVDTLSLPYPNGSGS